MKIATQGYSTTCRMDMDKLNEMAGEECFGLCFDVGHLNIVHGSITDYVTKLGSRINALHIHDNDMNGDLHLAPYTGTVRWVDLYTSLKGRPFF